MSVGNRLSGLFHNRGDLRDHRGNHRGRSVHKRSSHRSGSSHNRGSLHDRSFNDSFDSRGNGGGNIGSISRIGVVVVAGIRVVVESVIETVGVVSAVSVVVSVEKSLGFSFSFGLGSGLSLTFGQTGFLQSTNLTTVSSDAISRGENPSDGGNRSGNRGSGNGSGIVDQRADRGKSSRGSRVDQVIVGERQSIRRG